MKKRTASLVKVLLLVVIAGALLAACGSGSASTPTASGQGSGSTGSGSSADGQTLMQQRCSVCHSLDRIKQAQKTADQWQATVTRMIGHGAQLTPQEEQVLVNYLAQTYHP